MTDRAGDVGNSQAAVRLDHVCKSFGERQIVRDVSLAIPSGSVFGLIGPNGAGKSTLLKCLLGELTPDSGDVSVFGLHPIRDRQAFFSHVGVQQQNGGLYNRIRVGEAVRLFASFFARPLDGDSLLAEFGLAELRDSAFATLSGGERVRLLLVVALIGDPDVVVLDEPTTGLDPQARSAVWNAMLRMRGQGRTILLTTHYLEEAEDYCDTVALLDDGQVAAYGHPDHLLRESRLHTRVSFPADLFDGDVTSLRCPGFTTPALIGDVAVLFTSEGRPLDALAAAVGGRLGSAIADRASIRPANLEDLFLQRTGRAYQSATEAPGRPSRPLARKGSST